MNQTAELTHEKQKDVPVTQKTFLHYFGAKQLIQKGVPISVNF